jgi:hypothetical protein
LERNLKKLARNNIKGPLSPINAQINDATTTRNSSKKCSFDLGD